MVVLKQNVLVISNNTDKTAANILVSKIQSLGYSVTYMDCYKAISMSLVDRYSPYGTIILVGGPLASETAPAGFPYNTMGIIVQDFIAAGEAYTLVPAPGAIWYNKRPGLTSDTQKIVSGKDVWIVFGYSAADTVTAANTFSQLIEKPSVTTTGGATTTTTTTSGAVAQYAFGIPGIPKEYEIPIALAGGAVIALGALYFLTKRK